MPLLVSYFIAFGDCHAKTSIRFYPDYTGLACFKTDPSNIGNRIQDTIELLNQQLTIKDSQIKEKDEQLKLMQKLLDQSQQLQLLSKNGSTDLKYIVKNTDSLKKKTKRKRKWWNLW